MEQTQNPATNDANPRPYLRWAGTVGLVIGGVALSAVSTHYETSFKASHLTTPFLEYAEVAAPLLMGKVGGIAAAFVGVITAIKPTRRSEPTM